MAKGLGASLLCLSILAGCASTSEQGQPSEAIEAAPSKSEEGNTVSDNAPQLEGSTAQTPAVSEKPLAKVEEATSKSARTEPAQQVESSTTRPSETKANESPIADTVEVAPNTSVATNVTKQESSNEAASALPTARSNNNLGKSYGIWTLKKADNGFCKLKTPTLQISNKEYSSQIWMDVEEQRIVVNAYMPLDIEHPKTGIQIDSQALIPFTEKVNSTRALVKGDLTTQLANGNELHIFINGKEAGKQILRRDVKLSNMSSAINALKSCGF